MSSIQDIMKECHQTAVSKGWWEKDRNFGEQIALMHSELSEALEDWRVRGLNEPLWFEGNKPEGIAAEFADVLIRIFDTCEKYNIPLERALYLKMAYNQTRLYRHGGKLA